MEISCNYFTRNIKIIVSIIIFIVAIFGIMNINYAILDPGGGVPNSGSSGSSSSGTGLGNLDNYKNDTADSERVREIAGVLVSAIRLVGTIVSVGALVAIGIRYMTGSVEERADYKQSLKPYIIGAFVLFTGSLIPQLIYTLTQNFN